MSAPKAQPTPKPPAPPPAPPTERDVFANAQKATEDRQRTRRTLAGSYLGSSATPNTPAAGSAYLG